MSGPTGQWGFVLVKVHGQDGAPAGVAVLVDDGLDAVDLQALGMMGWVGGWVGGLVDDTERRELPTHPPTHPPSYLPTYLEEHQHVAAVAGHFPVGPGVHVEDKGAGAGRAHLPRARADAVARQGVLAGGVHAGIAAHDGQAFLG